MTKVRMRSDLAQDELHIPIVDKDKYLTAEEVEGGEVLNGDDEEAEHVIVRLTSGEEVMLYSVDLDYYEA